MVCNSALGHSAQVHKRCLITVNLTGLWVQGVTINSPTSRVPEQERSLYSILPIYLWAKQREKLTKHYRHFWRQDALYIKIQYILTTAAVSLRSLDVPAVHSNCWVMQIQQNQTKTKQNKTTTTKNLLSLGYQNLEFLQKCFWKLAQPDQLCHKLLTGMDKSFIDWSVIQVCRSSLWPNENMTDFRTLRVQIKHFLDSQVCTSAQLKSHPES